MTKKLIVERLIKNYEDNIGGGVFDINKTVTRKSMTNSLNKFLKQIRNEEIKLHSLRNESSVTTYEVFNNYIK